MRRIALLLMVFVWALAASPLAQINPGHDPELVGFYTVEGKNPDGKPYAGSAEIWKDGPIFKMRWEMESGEITYGFGFIVNGALSMTVFADPVSPHPIAPTVAVYAVSSADPLTLEGKWAVIAAPGIHPEVLTKVAKKPLPKPTHRL
jgi:hypothetical protein